IAWRLAGHAAAVFAVAVFAFDPNFLAHSPLVKNDMLFATCLLLTTIFVWTFAQRGTFWRFAGICLCAAMAFTVKFSGVLVVPMLALALLLLATSRRSWKVGPFLAHRPIERLALSCTLWTIVVLFIWLSMWICYD